MIVKDIRPFLTRFARSRGVHLRYSMVYLAELAGTINGNITSELQIGEIGCKDTDRCSQFRQMFNAIFRTWVCSE